MSFRVLRIVHGPEGGTAALVEHHQHGLAEIIQAEKDGHALIKLRRVAQSDSPRVGGPARCAARHLGAVHEDVGRDPRRGEGQAQMPRQWQTLHSMSTVLGTTQEE